MIVDYRYQSFDKLRSSLSFVVYPMHALVDAPFRWVEGVKDYTQRFSHLLEAHQALEAEQRVQQAHLQRLEAVEAENTQLRALLKVEPQAQQHFLMAQIVQVHTDPFMQRLVLNRGHQQGVVIGQPVIDAEGVLGEIIEVSAHESRAILLSDVGYGIPVENIRSGIRGIVTGNGLNQPLALQHVPNTIDLEVGDLLVTSGLEGHYPPGYPVGRVIALQQAPGESFAQVQVKASANQQRSRHVLILYDNPR